MLILKKIENSKIIILIPPNFKISSKTMLNFKMIGNRNDIFSVNKIEQNIKKMNSQFSVLEVKPKD